MRGWSPPRVLRTLRHLEAGQAVAQLHHLLRGGIRPVQLPGPAPTWRARAARTRFPAAPAHARLEGRYELELVGRAIRFADAIDWDHSTAGPLWAYHLHQFDYARDPALDAELRGELLLDWIARHRRGTGWDPHPTSLRLLSWGKLQLTSGALQLDAEGDRRLRASLANQLATLARHLEVRLQGNHLFSNRLALLFGAHLLEGSSSREWLEAGLALAGELDTQILDDGAHVERSPMYHSLLLENLLDLINLARAAPRPEAAAVVERAADCAARMLGALEIWTHPDGEIALFADSAHGIAQVPHTLSAYAADLDIRPTPPVRRGVLEAGGFVRLEADPYTLIASTAGPMPAHQPGHAHCDALAFELSIGGRRVVTDTGVCEYVPGRLRDLSRATHSHATLEVGGREQAEIWSAHRIGGRPTVALESADPPQRAEARCAGWSTPDSVHHRRFDVDRSGVVIHDRLAGRPRPVRFSLPLAPELEPAFETPNRVVIALAEASEVRLRIDLPRAEGLHWRVERQLYFPRFGVRLDRACLVGEAATFRAGEWRFELMTG